MKSQNSLDQLLAEARAGGDLESEGTFTIAGEAAIGKLASFQLPRKSAWILKIVQGAVRAGADALVIRQSNESTTFELNVDTDFCLDALRAALLTPEPPSDGGVSHLAIGLRAVGFGDKRAFTLAYVNEETRTILGWNGTNLVQRVEACSPTPGSILRIGVAFPPENTGKAFLGMVKAKGRATDEYQEVVQNGEACAIPLYFDGRRIDRLGGPGDADSQGSSVVLSLGWRPLQQGQVSFPRPLGLSLADPGWRPADRFTDSRVFFLTGDNHQRTVNSIVKLRYRYKVDSHRSKYSSFKFHSIEQYSYFYWVKDGVICHRERARGFACPVSFELYLPADDLPTDVSGLTLRPGEAQSQRLQHGLEHLRWQIQETEALLKAHLPKPFNVHSLMYAAIGIGGLAMAPVTLGKSAVVAGVAAIGLATSAYDKKQVLDDCIFCTGRLERHVGNYSPSR